MRIWLGLLLGAIIGGGIGYAQWLCPGGSCAITGSWFGGALVGGAGGTFLAGLIPTGGA